MTSEPYMLTWALPPPIRRKLFRVIPLLASSWVVPTMCPKRGRGGPTRCAQQRAASAQPSLFHRRLRHRSSSTTACSHVHPSARVRRATQVARLAAVGGSKASSSRSTSKGHPTKAMAGSWFQQLVQVGSEQEVCVFVCTWLLPCCVPFSLFYSPLTLSLSLVRSLSSLCILVFRVLTPFPSLCDPSRLPQRCVEGLCRGGSPPPLRLGTVMTSLTFRGLLFTQAGPLPGGLRHDSGAPWVLPFPIFATTLPLLGLST